MADDKSNGAELSDYVGSLNRRGFLTGSAAGAAMAFLAACAGNAPQTAAPEGGAATANLPFGKPLKAAFSNAGLGATWCAQGKETAEQWGKWLGVEITWFDGGLSIDKQRKAIDDMATKDVGLRRHPALRHRHAGRPGQDR